MAAPTTVTKMSVGNATMFHDTDIGNTVRKDLFAGPCRVTLLHVTNNSTASAESVVALLYDDENPTVGTTVPDFVLPIPTSSDRPFPLNPHGDPPGVLFSTGLSIAVVTSADWSGTASDPTGTCTMALWGKEEEV